MFLLSAVEFSNLDRNVDVYSHGAFSALVVICEDYVASAHCFVQYYPVWVEALQRALSCYKFSNNTTEKIL
jgi:hypothetical protein